MSRCREELPAGSLFQQAAALKPVLCQNRRAQKIRTLEVYYTSWEKIIHLQEVQHHWLGAGEEVDDGLVGRKGDGSLPVLLRPLRDSQIQGWPCVL